MVEISLLCIKSKSTFFDGLVDDTPSKKNLITGLLT